jgi:hypothetical protein
MNISFNLNKSFPVQIAVTDVSGRQHLVVDKGLMNENQTHNFQIDISALQSGIYSVILLTGNRIVKTNRILKL